jgi:hypothetical protein
MAGAPSSKVKRFKVQADGWYEIQLARHEGWGGGVESTRIYQSSHNNSVYNSSAITLYASPVVIDIPKNVR